MPGVWGDGVARSRAQGSGHARRSGSDVAGQAQALDDRIAVTVGVVADDALGVADDGRLGVGVELTADVELPALDRQRTLLLVVGQLDLVLVGLDQQGHEVERDLPPLAVGRRGAGGGVGGGGRAGDLGQLRHEATDAGRQPVGTGGLTDERLVVRSDAAESGELGRVDLDVGHLVLSSVVPTTCEGGDFCSHSRDNLVA